MKQFNIRFETVDEIRDFVNAARNYEGDLDLKSGNYFVDAKSLLGVLNVGTQKDICLIVNGKQDPEFLPRIHCAVA